MEMSHFGNFITLVNHMTDFHPNSDTWGDQGTGQDMWCFLCGCQIVRDSEPVSKEDVERQIEEREKRSYRHGARP